MAFGEIRPEETLNEVLQRGIEVFKNAVEGVSGLLRVGEQTIQQLDVAMTGKPVAPGETPDETFLNVVALLRAGMEEAQEHGSVSAPAVVQKAREALNRVTTMEPAWRPGPAVIQSARDMFRVALRDLRGSQALMRLAMGQGETEDLEKLVNWADDVGKRLEQTQKIVAQPKPGSTHSSAPASPPKGLSTEETMAYQNTELKKEMLLLERHLQQQCKIGGKACDCCEKHPITIQGLAEEALGMTGNQVYGDIIAWCARIAPYTTEAASASGQYDQHYPTWAKESRELRKRLPGPQPAAVSAG